ncbi:hypothetical protein D3C78_1028220 [compost metagenome]
MVAEKHQQQHADNNGCDDFSNDARADEVLQRVDTEQIHPKPEKQQHRATEHLRIG